MSSYEERARARAVWPIERHALGAEPLIDRRDRTSIDERLALVAVLTRAQWALGGLPWPTYARAEMPGRLILRAPRR